VYDAASVERAAKVVARLDRGHVVMAIAGVPDKCPPVPPPNPSMFAPSSSAAATRFRTADRARLYGPSTPSIRRARSSGLTGFAKW
jgi:hypothetical protein